MVITTSSDEPYAHLGNPADLTASLPEMRNCGLRARGPPARLMESRVIRLAAGFRTALRGRTPN